MRINHVVNKFDDLIFEVGNVHTSWINVEWELVVSLDAHESIPEIEQGESQWLFLDVTPEGFPIKWHILHL